MFGFPEYELWWSLYCIYVLLGSELLAKDLLHECSRAEEARGLGALFPISARSASPVKDFIHSNANY
jgi:hypothetical protein